MPLITWSPLAVPAPLTPDPHLRSSPTPWGLCCHTTGRGLTQKAIDRGADPMGLAIDAYCAPDPPGGFTVFPHYVIGWKGELIQIADERVRARHAAVTADERDAYLSGAWRKRVSLKGQTFWRDRWPRHFSPSNLYPSKSPNEDYIGVELIPLAKAESPGGTLFTPKQYDKLARLIADIESRYGLVLNGSRLVGHEDISPLTRWDKNGGWDPGALRAYPFFRWDLVRPSSSSVLG